MNPTLTDTFRRLLAEHDARSEHVDPVVIDAAATGGLQSLPRVPTKAPKPPPDVQDAIQAAAEDRRDRKRVRNLRNIGHSADCAMDMAMGHRPCSCVRAWLGDVRRCHDHKQEGASNE